MGRKSLSGFYTHYWTPDIQEIKENSLVLHLRVINLIFKCYLCNTKVLFLFTSSCPLSNSLKHLEIQWDHRSMLLGSGWWSMQKCCIQSGRSMTWIKIITGYTYLATCNHGKLTLLQNWSEDYRFTNHSRNWFSFKFLFPPQERWKYGYSSIFRFGMDYLKERSNSLYTVF